ncbi:GNAT family N-acetyltransferase [Sphaerisporangium viridialbum]|uniref:GNAT family N-acetyltransferase n=1 Tax=Sphaerisporangium viridialbum TaxID=46189 RepID=UPI003C73B437
MEIRECRDQDLGPLEHHIPSPGRNRFHEARFRRQEQGRSTFLVAWTDDIPVGSGEILWHGCAAPEVAQRYPDCPELNGLTVSPERQSQGIGTALVHAAEARARQRGHQRIGLGVDDENHRAAALYLRLGYEETGCRYLDRYQYLDDQGARHEAADPARFLVKRLQ